MNGTLSAPASHTQTSETTSPGETTLIEFVTAGSDSPRLDRAAGVITGVKLLGLASRNGRRYTETALREAATLYEGAKVNVNHPSGHPTAPRDYRDRLGTVRNVTLRPASGLFADLHFNPKHALAEQLMWDAEQAPHNVGFSHNVQARVSPRNGETLVERIVRVNSVDLVADPATTRGLFESQSHDEQNDTDTDATWRQLQEENTRLRGELDAAGRRHQVSELLAEFRLPLIESNDASEAAITSALFVEQLLATESVEMRRQLVEERARLVRALTEQQGSLLSGPRSRAATAHDPPPLDAARFAQSIS